jgi:hypothetical protein
VPQLLAPDDLLPLATPLWQRLAPAWTVEIRRVPAAEIGGAYGSTSGNSTTSRATILIDEALTGRDLAETLAHEMAHVNAWPVTEILDHGDARAVALFEPMIERFGLAAIASLARTRANRSKTAAAATAREGDCMDIALILAALRAALTSSDVAGAVQALVDEIAGMLPADAAAPEPMAGETAPMMMRRGLTALQALARKAAPADALGPKVLKRLGAKDDGAALMRVEALLLAEQANTGLLGAEDMRQRKAEAVETMRVSGLARPAFFVDGTDELLDVWKGGTLEEMREACGTLRRSRSPLARPRVEAAVGDEAGLVERARKSGMSVEARRASEANVNRGAAATKES